MLCISISGRWEQICRTYTNSSDMQMYWHITYVETFVVNAYLLKYFIAIFKNRFETLKLVIMWCDAFDNFLTDQYNYILIWDVDVRIWMLDNKIHLMTSSNLPICTCLVIGISVGLASPHQNFLFRWVPLLLKITINMCVFYIHHGLPWHIPLISMFELM